MSWAALVVVLAGGPGEWALPGFRMQVVASEAMEPDRLRALARPEVVLWVRTESNGLRRSTAETLQLAGSAFVQVRPPLGASALGPFVGRVGPWVAERGLDVARVRRWSPGRLAVDVDGPLTEELASRLRVLRPVAVRWSRGGWPGREEWTRARAFSAVELVGLGPEPVDCGLVPSGTRVRVRVPLASAPAEGVCGLPLRMEVPEAIDVGQVHGALLIHPDADLLVEVGEDVSRADGARRLLEQLVAATPHGDAPSRDGARRGDGGGP